MMQRNDLPPNDFAANPLYFAVKRLCSETTSKLRNSQGYPTTVFFIKTHQNGIAVGLVCKRTKTCVIGPLLGQSECKLTEKDDCPLRAKQLSLAAATHRTARVIWLCHGTARVIWLCHWTARVIWLCHRTAHVIWLCHRTARVIWLCHGTARVIWLCHWTARVMAVPQDCPCDMAVPQDCRVIWLCECADFMAKPLVGSRVSVVKVKSDHRSKFSNLSNWKEEA